MLDVFTRPEFNGATARIEFEGQHAVEGKVTCNQQIQVLVVKGAQSVGVAIPNLADLVAKTCVMTVGMKDGVYKFPTVCKIARTADFVFELPTRFDMERSQRRDYVRVEVEIAGKLLAGANGEAPVKLLDLSGGGTLLSSPLIVPRDEVVFVEFPCDGVTLRLEGKVTRSDDAKKLLGLQFINPREAERERIVRFTFQKQTKQRAK